MFPSSTRILIVDNSEEFRSIAKIQLTRLGYQFILEADNANLAFQIVVEGKRRGEPIGLILLDWHLPVSNGLVFLQKLKSNPALGKIPILVLTAEEEERNIVHAIAAGATDYAFKPLSEEKLLEKISGVWAKSGSAAPKTSKNRKSLPQGHQ